MILVLWQAKTVGRVGQICIEHPASFCLMRQPQCNWGGNAVISACDKHGLWPVSFLVLRRSFGLQTSTVAMLQLSQNGLRCRHGLSTIKLIYIQYSLCTPTTRVSSLRNGRLCSQMFQHHIQCRHLGLVNLLWSYVVSFCKTSLHPFIPYFHSCPGILRLPVLLKRSWNGRCP